MRTAHHQPAGHPAAAGAHTRITTAHVSSRANAARHAGHSRPQARLAAPAVHVVEDGLDAD